MFARPRPLFAVRHCALPWALASALAGCGEPSSTDAARDPTAFSVALASARPAWATRDRLVGRADPAQQVGVQIHLRLRDEDAAEAEAYAVNDPQDPRYGQFLSTEEFHARYAPRSGDAEVVQRWLVEQGLRVEAMPDNRLLIRARGSVAQIEAAFGTRLGLYRLGDRQLRAPMTSPSIPSRLAPLMATALGLSESFVLPREARTGARFTSELAPPAAGASGDAIPPPPGSRDGRPCSRWWSELEDHVDPPYGGGFPDPLPYITCGYTPPRLRAAYGLTEAVRQGNDGRGVTVAIVSAFAASPTLLSDAQTYAALNDAGYPLRAAQFTAIQGPGSDPVPPPDPGLVQAWWQNQTQSVEALHAMAPGAHILYVGSRSPEDADQIAAVNHVVDHNLATLVDNPWTAGPEPGVSDRTPYHTMAIHAALKGIGLYFPSGDGGDNGPGAGSPDAPSPDFPASLPLVTAVGATSLGIGRLNERVFEVGAETAISVLRPDTMTYSPPAPGRFFFGSGGGTSGLYRQPRYQRGVVPPALANLHGAPARVTPDVAMVGHLVTGFLIGQTQSFPDGVSYGERTVGDSSLACPLLVGVMALAEQRRHRRIGFANPMLYGAAHGPAFHDIVPGPLRAVSVVAFNNGLDDSAGVTHIAAPLEYQGLTIHPAPGYDNVTGLGSPNGEAFLRALR